MRTTNIESKVGLKTRERVPEDPTPMLRTILRIEFPALDLLWQKENYLMNKEYAQSSNHLSAKEIEATKMEIEALKKEIQNRRLEVIEHIKFVLNNSQHPDFDKRCLVDLFVILYKFHFYWDDIKHWGMKNILLNLFIQHVNTFNWNNLSNTLTALANLGLTWQYIKKKELHRYIYDAIYKHADSFRSRDVCSVLRALACMGVSWEEIKNQGIASKLLKSVYKEVDNILADTKSLTQFKQAQIWFEFTLDNAVQKKINVALEKEPAPNSSPSHRRIAERIKLLTNEEFENEKCFANVLYVDMCFKKKNAKGKYIAIEYDGYDHDFKIIQDRFKKALLKKCNVKVEHITYRDRQDDVSLERILVKHGLQLKDYSIDNRHKNAAENDEWKPVGRRKATSVSYSIQPSASEPMIGSADSNSVTKHKRSQSLSAQSLSSQSLSTELLSAQSLSAQTLSAQSLSTQSLSAQSLSMLTETYSSESTCAGVSTTSEHQSIDQMSAATTTTVMPSSSTTSMVASTLVMSQTQSPLTRRAQAHSKLPSTSVVSRKISKQQQYELIRTNEDASMSKKNNHEAGQALTTTGKALSATNGLSVPKKAKQNASNNNVGLFAFNIATSKKHMKSNRQTQSNETVNYSVTCNRHCLFASAVVAVVSVGVTAASLMSHYSQP